MSDTPDSNIHQSFREKGTSKFLDPCQKESINSMNCLDKHNYDKGKCKDFFDLYRECKKKWVSLYSFYIIYLSFLYGYSCIFFPLQLEERRELRRKGLL